ncbi:MAG: ABC transporter ATP-binding protein, partial [Planctomycetota bacterium]
MIELVDVWHHYGVRPTLRGIDLRVEAGELVCVMGPNGMGKSTLLKVAAGVLPCLRGSVAIDGQRRRSSVEVEAEIRRKVAYLPDTPWLPWVTAREFLVACGRVYGVAEERLFDHAERLLGLFHLDGEADKTVGDYSTGQKKKLGLCAALVTDAPVLLLDEPFSGGIDSSGLRAIQAVLQHIAEDQARTV